MSTSAPTIADLPLPSWDVLSELLTNAADPALDPAASASWPLFMELQDSLAAADQATAQRDRLEADLLNRLGYPRIELPPYLAGPNAFAADFGTIDRLLKGRRHTAGLRARLKRCLREQHHRWQRQADAAGLTEAEHLEDDALAELTSATVRLLSGPVTDLPGLWIALAVVIAAGQPGPVFQDSFPWRVLRKLLDTVAALAARDTALNHSTGSTNIHQQ